MCNLKIQYNIRQCGYWFPLIHLLCALSYLYSALHFHFKRKNDTYVKSGVYPLSCKSCNHVYGGQTGRKFREPYKENLRGIKYNWKISKYAKHILRTAHSDRPIQDIMQTAEERRAHH